KPTCVDHVVLDPVVDHTFTNTELFGDLLHGKLLGFLEWGRRDLITPTNPANDGHGVRFTLGTDMIFPIKLIGDLRIELVVGQLANPIDNRGRVTELVCSFGWEWHREIGAGAAVPTDMNGELPLLG